MGVYIKDKNDKLMLIFSGLIYVQDSVQAELGANMLECSLKY